MRRVLLAQASAASALLQATGCSGCARALSALGCSSSGSGSSSGAAQQQATGVHSAGHQHEPTCSSAAPPPSGSTRPAGWACGGGGSGSSSSIDGRSRSSSVVSGSGSGAQRGDGPAGSSAASCSSDGLVRRPRWPGPAASPLEPLGGGSGWGQPLLGARSTRVCQLHAGAHDSHHQHPQQVQQQRGYGTRRPNSLSTRRANNLASRLAVEDVLGEGWRGAPPGAEPTPKPAAAPLPPAVPTAIPPVPAVPEPDHWRRVGRVEGLYTVPPQDAFAVVQLGPFQYKVTADDVILHPKLVGAEVNDVLALGKVLLLGSPQDTVIGRPYVPGAAVVAAVESHFRDAKVHVFKKKPRKRYSKLKGHRAQLTSLRILQVLPDGLPAAWQQQQDATAVAGAGSGGQSIGEGGAAAAAAPAP